MPNPFPLFVLIVAVWSGLVFYTQSVTRQKTSGIPVCVDSEENSSKELRKYAQKALDAIGSKHKLSASYKRANRGEHVFNHGLLRFHNNVLQDLLNDEDLQRDLRGYEELENLVQDLMIPLTQSQRESISTMVAHFRRDEFYVDFNADLYGEYALQLHEALVAYLKAATSPNEDDRHGIQSIRSRVNNIARQMVNYMVYVDPMARDRWLQQNPDKHKVYKGVIDALKKMFEYILLHFQKVEDKIRAFRRASRRN